MRLFRERGGTAWVRRIAMAAVTGLAMLAGTISLAAGAERAVRVGIFQNEPVVYMDQTGVPGGLYVDVLNAIAEREGWAVEYVPGSWAEGLERLRNGSIDLMTSIAYTKERDQVFDYSSENVLTMWGQVYLPRASRAQSILDLDKKRIAVLRGGINGLKFIALCQQFSIDCRIETVDTYEEVFRLVSDGAVDAGVVNNVYGYAHEIGRPLNRSPIVFNPFSLLFAISAGGDAGLIATVDQYLQRWKLESDSPYQKALAAMAGSSGRMQGIPQWFFPVLLGGLGVIALLGGWILVFYLRIQVRKKTEHLRHEIEKKEQTERRLSESEVRYRLLVEQAGDALLLSEFLTGKIIDVNNQACESYGYSRDEFLSLFTHDISPSFSKEKRDDFFETMDRDGPISIEVIHRRKDGSTFPVEIRARVIELDNRKLILAFARDVTERKRAEDALRVSEDRTRKIIDNSAAGYVCIDRDGRFTEVNEAWLRMHRFSSADKVIGRHFANTQVEMDFVEAQKTVAELMSGVPVPEGEFSRLCGDGSIGYHSFSGAPVFAEGKIVGFEGFLIDVTERKRAEEKLKAAIRIADLGYWFWDAETDILDCSDEFHRLLGLEEETIENATENFIKLIHPDDQKLVGNAIEKMTNELAPYDIEYRVVRPVDGKIAWIHTVAEHVAGEGGVLVGMSGTAQDITERKQMENHLRQAQKMGAVGKLTGGVAHEFNNLLQTIMGNLQLLRDYPGDHDETAKMLDRAITATIRGGELTRQLLSFSRKQVLSSEAININRSLLSVSHLLQGMLGVDISLATKFAADLVSVDIDAGNFESAILNLALNARSAMPDGGVVTIETANVSLAEAIPHEDGDLPAGRYVVVTVSDTGCGMSPEVLEQAFVPFFTTRDIGEGTGLGLSSVYGFAKQSGGHTTIESEPGKGTTVSMYLPIAMV